MSTKNSGEINFSAEKAMQNVLKQLGVIDEAADKLTKKERELDINVNATATKKQLKDLISDVKSTYTEMAKIYQKFEKTTSNAQKKKYSNQIETMNGRLLAQGKGSISQDDVIKGMTSALKELGVEADKTKDILSTITSAQNRKAKSGNLTDYIKELREVGVASKDGSEQVSQSMEKQTSAVRKAREEVEKLSQAKKELNTTSAPSNKSGISSPISNQSEEERALALQEKRLQLQKDHIRLVKEASDLESVYTKLESEQGYDFRSQETSQANVTLLEKLIELRKNENALREEGIEFDSRLREIAGMREDSLDDELRLAQGVLQDWIDVNNQIKSVRDNQKDLAYYMEEVVRLRSNVRSENWLDDADKKDTIEALQWAEKSLQENIKFYQSMSNENEIPSENTQSLTKTVDVQERLRELVSKTKISESEFAEILKNLPIEKMRQMNNMFERTFELTSDIGTAVQIYTSGLGKYFEVTGTRSGFNFFLDNDGNFTRKPSKNKVSFEKSQWLGNMISLHDAWDTAQERLKTTDVTPVDAAPLKEAINYYREIQDIQRSLDDSYIQNRQLFPVAAYGFDSVEGAEEALRICDEMIAKMKEYYSLAEKEGYSSNALQEMSGSILDVTENIRPAVESALKNVKTSFEERILNNEIGFNIDNSKSNAPKELLDEYIRVIAQINNGSLKAQDGIELLNARAKELGVTFDSVSKKWVSIVTTPKTDKTPVSKEGATAVEKTTEALKEATAEAEKLKQEVKEATSIPATDSKERTLSSDKPVQQQEEFQAETKESQQVIENATNAEGQVLTELSGKVDSVTTAVNEKTKAFAKEEQVVRESVGKEVNALVHLEEQLGKVKSATGKIGDVKVTNNVSNTNSSNSNVKTSKSSIKETSVDDKIIQRYQRDISNSVYSFNKKYSGYREYDTVVDKLNEIKKAASSISNQDEFNKLNNEVKVLAASLDKVQIPKDLAREKWGNKFYKYLNENTKAAKQFGGTIEKLKTQYESIETVGDLEQFGIDFTRYQKLVEKAGLTGLSTMDAIVKRAKSMSTSFISMYLSLYDIARYGKQAADAVIKIDTAMTELKKVSSASLNEINNSFDDMADSAKRYGSSVTDMINATADWSKMGYNLPDSKKLAEISVLYKNVGDGIDIDTANESLISTLKGFQLEAKDAMGIIDSFNEVKCMPLYIVICNIKSSYIG